MAQKLAAESKTGVKPAPKPQKKDLSAEDFIFMYIDEACRIAREAGISNDEVVAMLHSCLTYWAAQSVEAAAAKAK